MREVPFRVGQLLRRRATLGWWLTLVAANLGSCALPLVRLSLFELAAALTLTAGTLGLGVSIAATGGRPLQGAREWPEVSLLLLAAGLPALALHLSITWLGTPCSLTWGASFVPVLVVPSALLSASVGMTITRWTSKWRFAVPLALLAVLISALSTAWPLVFGPQAFAFNHFGGALLGPIYDEALAVTPALLWFRLATICLAGTLAAASLRWRGLALGLGVLFLALEFQGPTLGFRQNDEHLEQTLGGRVTREGITVIHSTSFTPDEVSRFVDDVRFRRHQITTFLGIDPQSPVTIWWYRSASEKQRLVGAADTQFAKPWRREVHVNGAETPNAVLKHELAHALASSWGAPPFGVTATWAGLNPNPGVIEGLAVAADNPVDELTLHEWAAAMKRQNMLPNVASLLTPEGFYAAPASRAYTTAGSFLRYLVEQHGSEKLRALYAHGDVEGVYGQSRETLATAYLAFLDTIPLNDADVQVAFQRFRRGSLFDRPCAREVATAMARANEVGAERPHETLALVRQCRALQPEEPSLVLSEAGTLGRLGKTDDAAHALDAELERLESEPSSWAAAALARAELAMRTGDRTKAVTLWKRVLEREPTPSSERTAHVRLASAALPESQSAAVDHFFASPTGESTLAELFDAQRASSDWSLAYLLGRRLIQLKRDEQGLEVFAPLRSADLPESVSKEAARLTVEALARLGRCDQAEQVDAAGKFGHGFAIRAQDPVARCRFLAPAGGER